MAIAMEIWGIMASLDVLQPVLSCPSNHKCWTAGVRGAILACSLRPPCMNRSAYELVKPPLALPTLSAPRIQGSSRLTGSCHLWRMIFPSELSLTTYNNCPLTLASFG